MTCLGKAPARHDPRTLKLSTLLTSALPAPPLVRDWEMKLPADLGMMRNDSIGDCTCAAAGHAIQAWTKDSTGTETTISDDDVVAAYSAVTGYTPSNPLSDRGAVLLDVLNYWRQTGIGGHKIGAYALVDHTNTAEMKTACALFGGLYTGAMLPVSAQADVGSLWHRVASDDGGSWGGHCLYLYGHDWSNVKYITWGKRQYATLPWFLAYADECYAVISEDWVTGAKLAPSGFDLAKLQQYLADLK